MTAHIRVENDTVMGHTARVVYVDSDGTETDISSACRGVRINLTVGEVTTAELDMFLIPGSVKAELVDVAVENLRRDVTAVGDTKRWYAR